MKESDGICMILAQGASEEFFKVLLGYFGKFREPGAFSLNGLGRCRCSLGPNVGGTV
jgi:hypothetical protein